jgi:uncharacterized small protein (DUF1192 family)
VAFSSLTGHAFAQDAPALTSDNEKLSYALGMDLGNQLRRLGVQVDPTVFGKALGDALSGGKTLMTPEEARQRIGALQEDLKRREAEMRMLAPGRTGTGQVAPVPQPAGASGQAAPAAKP